MTPLIFDDQATLLKSASEKSPSCWSMSGWTIQQKACCFKVSTYILGIISGLCLGHSIYDTVTAFRESPLSVKNEVYSIIRLTASTLMSTLSACLIVAHRCIYCYFRTMYPHNQHNQGSVYEILTYHDQTNNLRDVERWKPHVRQFLNHFEQAQQARFLPRWLKLKNFASIEEAITPIASSLQKGGCYGYSMALLSCMQKYACQPSSELLNHIRIETVVAYQILHRFIIFCQSDKSLLSEWFKSTIIYKKNLQNDSKAHKKIDWDEEIQKGKWNSYDYLFLHALGFDLDRNGFWESDDFINMAETDSAKLKIVLDQGIQELKNKFVNQSLTIAGKITLRVSETDEAKDGFPGHALFFQCSDGYFRFHDSGSILARFFEFETQANLLDNLIEHFKTWPEYKDGRLRFTIIAIPHSADSDLDEVLLT